MRSSDMDKKKTSRAVNILNRRYIKDDKERKKSLESERVNSSVASMIYQLRTEADLNQKELADLVGTTQSVISRLEDADYEGHSLSMLERITKALGHKLRLAAIPQHSPAEVEIHFAFQKFVSSLRRLKKLSIDDMAIKLELDRDVILALESDMNYKPAPMILYKLSKFFDIPQAKLNALAGAIKEIPEDLRAEASRFAAKAESFTSLTKEEKKSLDNFMKTLRAKA